MYSNNFLKDRQSFNLLTKWVVKWFTSLFDSLLLWLFTISIRWFSVSKGCIQIDKKFRIFSSSFSYSVIPERPSFLWFPTSLEVVFFRSIRVFFIIRDMWRLFAKQVLFHWILVAVVSIIISDHMEFHILFWCRRACSPSKNFWVDFWVILPFSLSIQKRNGGNGDIQPFQRQIMNVKKARLLPC